MLDQETDNTETSNQIDISVAISFKQQDKAKKKQIKDWRDLSKSNEKR